MKRLLALFAVLALVVPARAHFIWILPADDGAKMVFSDDLSPDKNVPITKIAHTKLRGRDADGKDVEVIGTEAKDHYVLTQKAGAKNLSTIGGTCQYGVVARGKGDPFLLVYHAKTLFQVGKDAPGHIYEGWSALPLEIVPHKGKKMTAQVLWQGKPLAKAEVVLMVPGVEEAVERTTDAQGLVELTPPLKDGLYGMRVRHTEAKEGELDGKKYKEIRHYATLTARVKAAAPNKEKTSADSDQAPSDADGKTDGKTEADPAATKLLADARAARAVWTDFPGFSADLVLNQNGKLHKGKVDVSAAGKVVVTLDDGELKDQVRRSIMSLVSHRMPGGPRETPCAFPDANADHPQGRTVKVLNDELHSSYRIRDRQIMEVNRQMGDSRFTISVVENLWNKEKQYLPSHYVVNTWDLKTKTLKSSQTHQQTWTRVGNFDLPVTLLVVTAAPDRLDSNLLTFSKYKLSGTDGARSAP